MGAVRKLCNARETGARVKESIRAIGGSGKSRFLRYVIYERLLGYERLSKGLFIYYVNIFWGGGTRKCGRLLTSEGVGGFGMST